MSQKKAKQWRRELRRKNQEVRAALAEQLRLLEKRCQEFDEGDWGEAVDIATRLRVIFQEGGRSKPSILQSLEAREVPMLSTCDYHEDVSKVLWLGGGLYTQEHGKDVEGYYFKLYPALGNGPISIEVPAFRWWNAVVEIKPATVDDPDKHVYRRTDVVKGISEHDGGAHFASKIPEAYDVLTRPGGLVKLTVESGEEIREVPIAGVHLAMLRQIAYETLNSPALRDLADPRRDA